MAGAGESWLAIAIANVEGDDLGDGESTISLHAGDSLEVLRQIKHKDIDWCWGYNKTTGHVGYFSRLNVETDTQHQEQGPNSLDRSSSVPRATNTSKEIVRENTPSLQFSPSIKYGIPPGLKIDRETLPVSGYDLPPKKSYQYGSSPTPAMKRGRRMQASAAALVHNLLDGGTSIEQLKSEQHIPAIQGLNRLARQLKEEVDQLHTENAKIKSDVMLRQIQHREELASLEAEISTAEEAKQTIQHLREQLKQSKTKLRRMRREIETLNLMSKSSLNKFNHLVKRGCAEDAVSKSRGDSVSAGSPQISLKGSSTSSMPGLIDQTKHIQTVNEIAARLEKLSPDLALKMELIQNMRQESRNRKVSDNVEEVIWLSIDRVISGINDIKTRLSELVLANVDEADIILSQRNTIQSLQEKLSRQREALDEMASELEQEKVISSKMRDRLSKVRRRASTTGYTH